MDAEQAYSEQMIRWLEGDLSGDELSAFEASQEFKDYSKIMDASESISFPIMDEVEVFSAIQEKIAQSNAVKKPSKVISIKKWAASIAAIAILAFAVVSLLPSTVQISSGVGQFVSHSLPDGSEININGKSKIKYKENFNEDRVLHLEGEAFFNVKKGKSFVVETDEGSVSVLGTSFNVLSRNGYLIVSCKTGKVKVETENNSVILKQGERVRIENKLFNGKELIENSKIGTWINGESYFSNSNLELVVLSMTSVYDTEIKLPSQYAKERFTGSFVHGDLNKALKMVFSPMGISYSMDDSGKILITSE
jgi:ferric-dicitrate binding protein FerR (iron transport regulator)